jgi:sugar/nucleoside kinase (ribokinase family)
MPLSQSQVPDYLIVGHVTRDKTSQGPVLGGTCSYSAVTAQRLGKSSAAVTGCGPDIDPAAELSAIGFAVHPADRSTVFENIYEDGVRRQKWWSSSAPLSLDDVPVAWRSAAIVHLAPVAQEVPPALCNDFPGGLICATLQGWLRGKDSYNNVVYQPHPDIESWLSRIDIIVLSLADVCGSRAALDRFLTAARVGVETMGSLGCRVYHRGLVMHIPVKPEIEVDPTGAGDIFAAAFFIRYQETGDPIRSAQFANACASLSVRRRGMESIPDLSEVEAHLAELYGGK